MNLHLHCVHILYGMIAQIDVLAHIESDESVAEQLGVLKNEAMKTRDLAVHRLMCAPRSPEQDPSYPATETIRPDEDPGNKA